MAFLIRNKRHLMTLKIYGQLRRTSMPGFLIMWAAPAVIFVGGLGYFLLRAVH